MNPDEIIRALRENADWCDANEYEIPLCMGDNQWEAADLIESLQAQLAESPRMEKATVEMNEDNRVRLLQYDNLRKCFSELCDLILGRKYYNEAMDTYRADEFCCRDIWDKVKPMLSRKQWRGPQEDGNENI